MKVTLVVMEKAPGREATRGFGKADDLKLI